MRKDNEKDQAFIEEVKQKLDWYINDAPADEYDEKAVASLEYLLETLEPTDDFKVDEEKAWVEFKKYVSERQIHNEKKGENPPTTTTQQKGPAFLFRHKGLVAAAILVLLLAVSISTSSEAVRDNGFFHWIKEMTGGRKMITVPEDLDAMTEQEQTDIYTNRESIPDEWKEWSEKEKDVMDGEDVEWSYIEVTESRDKIYVRSHYQHQDNHIIMGVLEYANGSILDVETFDRFDRYETWNIEGKEFGVGCIQEEKRTLYYIEFFGENYKYYVVGPEETLEIIKKLVVEYRYVIQEIINF